MVEPRSVQTKILKLFNIFHQPQDMNKTKNTDKNWIDRENEKNKNKTS